MLCSKTQTHSGPSQLLRTQAAVKLCHLQNGATARFHSPKGRPSFLVDMVRIPRTRACLRGQRIGPAMSSESRILDATQDPGKAPFMSRNYGTVAITTAMATITSNRLGTDFSTSCISRTAAITPTNRGILSAWLCKACTLGILHSPHRYTMPHPWKAAAQTCRHY